MGNKVSQASSFNLREMEELSGFISNINMLDGFYMDTTLSISSKCLVLINSLINDGNFDGIRLLSGLEISPSDIITNKIEKLRFHCGLIRHLAVVNSAINRIEEIIELNNVNHLTSLTLDHVSIRLVQHLKQHRHSLLKLCVYHSLENLESLINLCGGDHSFSENWTNLLHLDVRYNNLRSVGDSVMLLPSLTVLDISRNDIEDISFIKKIQTLVCLNASFNYIRSLPVITCPRLRVLILAYNYLDGVEGIKGFKLITTLNVSFNMITTNDYLQQIKEMDYLQDLVVRGNPFSYSHRYRLKVLDFVSPRVAINFALDGVPLSNKENIYLRKRPMIQIAPALAPPSIVYQEVPIIIANRNEQIGADSVNKESQSYANSLARRNINYPMIASQSESSSNANETEDTTIIRRSHIEDREKVIDSMYDGDVILGNTNIDEVPFTRSKTVSTVDDGYIYGTPCYVGDKSSNFFIVSADVVWKSFLHVSVQIIEHKLMIVNDRDVIVDNIDLWQLIAITHDSLLDHNDSDKVLKMVFFVSYKESTLGLSLCTKTIKFSKVEELQTFSKQLRLYLNGFKITYDNWSKLPLVNISIRCKMCCSIFIPQYDNIRPICCDNCSGVEFMLENIAPVAPEPPTVPNPPVSDRILVNKIISKVSTPVLSRAANKSSTSNLVIQAFGSNDSLPKINSDKESLHSDNTSYYTGINDSNIDQSVRSQDEISDISVSNNFNECKDDDDDDEDNGLLATYLDKSIDGRSINLTLSPDPYYTPDDRYRKNNLKLDSAVDISVMSLDKAILPHECFDNNPRGVLMSKLNNPWIIHEPCCDVNIYMHSNGTIDDRVKLYFLTKVMADQENILAVFKVYMAYKSTGMTTSTLAVVSDQRLLMFNVLDKVSANMEECIKIACEFNLKSLQKCEYCLNYQWLELQFKNKSLLTLFVGDGKSVKNLGICITEAVSKKATNLTVIFSKEIEKLKCPLILSAMTNDLYDGVTMDTLSCSESYLIKGSSLIPALEKSTLEYAPKLIVIEREHIFFITVTYSLKAAQASFELCRAVSLLSVNTIVLDSGTESCSARLLAHDHGHNLTIDITFLSPNSRSKSLFCIERMLIDLFQVQVPFHTDDFSLDN